MKVQLVCSGKKLLEASIATGLNASGRGPKKLRTV